MAKRSRLPPTEQTTLCLIEDSGIKSCELYDRVRIVNKHFDYYYLRVIIDDSIVCLSNEIYTIIEIKDNLITITDGKTRVIYNNPKFIHINTSSLLDEEKHINNTQNKIETLIKKYDIKYVIEGNYTKRNFLKLLKWLDSYYEEYGNDEYNEFIAEMVFDKTIYKRLVASACVIKGELNNFYILDATIISIRNDIWILGNGDSYMKDD